MYFDKEHSTKCCTKCPKDNIPGLARVLIVDDSEDKILFEEVMELFSWVIL